MSPTTSHPSRTYDAPAIVLSVLPKRSGAASFRAGTQPLRNAVLRRFFNGRLVSNSGAPGLRARETGGGLAKWPLGELSHRWELIRGFRGVLAGHTVCRYREQTHSEAQSCRDLSR